MFRLSDITLVGSMEELRGIPEGKVLINTINAHSYNVAQKDEEFAEALRTIDNSQFFDERSGKAERTIDNGCVKYLIPDGASIVKACRWLKAKSQPKERIAGWDLFSFEMNALERKSEKWKVKSEKCEGRSEKCEGRSEKWKVKSEEWEGRSEKWKVKSEECEGRSEKCGKVMFMGSSERVLRLIRERAAGDYPNLEIVTYSPPYKAEFTEEDNRAIVQAINEAKPNLLWIGMTAPKQEKWTYQHWKELDIDCHVGTIGAVFDFYAGTATRAPKWWQAHGLEWLYRLMIEPRRMWRRYVIGNPLFIWNIRKELRGKN